MEAETGVMCLQVKKCQGLLAATGSYEIGMEHILPQGLEGNKSQTFGLGENYERINFCCKPPSLWEFVTAVLRN